MRPTCEKILDMPLIRKKIEYIFPGDFLYETHANMNLLSTIRVPKNLLYLTDRLPKPNYDNEERKRREKEEKFRRRTYEGGNSMLPDINSSTSPVERSDGQSLKQSNNQMPSVLVKNNKGGIVTKSKKMADQRGVSNDSNILKQKIQHQASEPSTISRPANESSA
jgi:NIMA (never in mitosis gene a)-related kinase